MQAIEMLTQLCSRPDGLGENYEIDNDQVVRAGIFVSGIVIGTLCAVRIPDLRDREGRHRIGDSGR